MTFPTVNKFLCYFDLTFGGLIIGYLGAALNAFCALFLLADLFVDENKFERDIFDFADVVEEEREKNLPTWAFTTLAIFILAILIGFCIISLWFIQGVKNRDSRKIRHFLTIMIIGTCGAFAKGILKPSFVWIVIGMINVYFIICIYSLHQVIESDGYEQAKSHSGANMQGYNKVCKDGINCDGYQKDNFDEP